MDSVSGGMEQHGVDRANSFKRLSGLYDEVRPDYPEELINDVIVISGIRPSNKILEIGIGTGKATKPFAERQFEITGVDISEELIRVARKNLIGFPNITYMAGSFELAELSSDYDMIFSAQAFHYIRPEIGYKKAHQCLKEGGHLAIFANFQARDELDQEVRKLYAKYCPRFPGEEYGTLRNLQHKFESSGFFLAVERKAYLRNIEYSKDNYSGFVESMSWVAILPKESKSLLFRDLEYLLKDIQNLVVPIESILLIAQKK